MFKFKSIFSESGIFFVNNAPMKFDKWKYETNDEEIAECLRKNSCFEEIKEIKKRKK